MLRIPFILTGCYCLPLTLSIFKNNISVFERTLFLMFAAYEQHIARFFISTLFLNRNSLNILFTEYPYLVKPGLKSCFSISILKKVGLEHTDIQIDPVEPTGIHPFKLVLDRCMEAESDSQSI